MLLTVDRNTKRHERMRGFFAQHGYNSVEWIYGRPTENHHDGARETSIETLRAIRCPVLWLEDDATPTVDYHEHLTVPDDAQVAYLGGGRFGFMSWAFRQWQRFARTDLLENAKLTLPHPNHRPERRAVYLDTADPAWIRVLMMFTGHAILWLDDQVREAAADAIASSRENYDLAWSRQLWHYRVYGLRKPYFYQADGHHAHTLNYCPEA